jgi:hypothetical protein
MGFEQAASAGSRINKRSAAAMKLELERGPGCSDLHQVARCRERQGVKARRARRPGGQGAFRCFPTRLYQHGDQHGGFAGARDAARGACEPRTSLTSTASQCHLRSNQGTDLSERLKPHGTNRSCRGSTLQPSMASLHSFAASLLSPVTPPSAWVSR